MASIIRSVLTKDLLRSSSITRLNRTIRLVSSTSFVVLKNSNIATNLNQVGSKSAIPNSFAIGKRFYADEKKLTNEQVAEKVLNIFTNFDRIKENPANLKVSLDSHVIKDLGLDSLDHVEIIVQLEDTFGFEIPDSDYEKLYTPKEIVNYLLKKML